MSKASASKRQRKKSDVVLEEVERRALDRAQQVRAKVQANFESSLMDFVEQEDCTKLGSIHALTGSIETALYETFKEANGSCGTPYRTKYMSLLFNLKDPKNTRLRAGILSGTITPDRLVHMTPIEMANEDLSEMIKSVRERSVSQAVLDDELLDASGLVRKTHKGEEPLTLKEESEKPHDHYYSAAVAPIISDHGSDEPTASYENTLSSSTRSTNNDWTGLVLLSDIANFEGGARSVGTHELLKSLLNHLPANLHISGRLPPSRGLDYLRSMYDIPTRSIHVLRLDPAVEYGRIEAGSKGDPERLISYLVESNRWAVISVDTTGPLRDIYLVPCRNLDILALVQLGILEDNAAVHDDKAFLMIVVTSMHSRGKRH